MTTSKSELRFVHGEAALHVDDSLIIAELHIGYEQRFFPDMDVFFTDKLIARVRALLDKTKARRLIINGDVKHSVRGATPEEQRELAKFFDAMKKQGVRTTIVKGNHDGDIERFVHNAEIVGQGGLLLGGVGVFHGNAWPSKEIAEKAKTLVLAHTHPCVELGGRQLQCWLVGRLCAKARTRFRHWRSARVIVMPAFSQLVGCASINKHPAKARLLGPLFRNEMFKIGEAEVYTLDGVCVGRLKDLAQR